MNSTGRFEIYLKQNDTEPALEGQLVDASGNPVNLAGASARCLGRHAISQRVVIDGACYITDPASGVIRYEWSPLDTARPGVFQVEVEVTYGDGNRETFPNRGHIRLRIADDVA